MIKEEIEKIKRECVNLLSHVNEPQVKDGFKRLNGEPGLLVQLLAKTKEYMLQIQNSLAAQQGICGQSQENEKVLRKQVDEMMTLINVKNVQLNVAFRRLVDLGEKVRSEQRSKQIAIKETMFGRIGLPEKSLASKATNTVAPTLRAAQNFNYMDSMRPSITKAMEDIDDEVKSLIDWLEKEDDEEMELDNVNGGVSFRKESNARMPSMQQNDMDGAKQARGRQDAAADDQPIPKTPSRSQFAGRIPKSPLSRLPSMRNDRMRNMNDTMRNFNDIASMGGKSLQTIQTIDERTMELLYFGNGFGGIQGDTQSLANLVITPSMQGFQAGRQ